MPDDQVDFRAGGLKYGIEQQLDAGTRDLLERFHVALLQRAFALQQVRTGGADCTASLSTDDALQAALEIAARWGGKQDAPEGCSAVAPGVGHG